MLLIKNIEKFQMVFVRTSDFYYGTDKENVTKWGTKCVFYRALPSNLTF